MEGFFVCLAILVAGASLWWHVSRSRQLLERWAEAEGLEIVHSERRWFRRGPYFWTTSKGQEVFHATVRRPDGEMRDVWVRVGSYWFGLLSSNVDCKWDS